MSSDGVFIVYVGNVFAQLFSRIKLKMATAQS